MLKNLNVKIILLVGLFVLVLSGIVFYVLRLGNAYRQNIETVESNPAPQNQSTTKTTKIKKVTVRTPGDSEGCTEISPDGAVIIYDICQEKISSAQRVVSTDAVWKLMSTVSTVRSNAIPSATAYVITVETDDGSYTIYIEPGSGGNTGTDMTVITIIKDIIESIPTPTVTSYPRITTPSHTPIVYMSPVPTSVLPPGVTTVPTPTVIGVKKPFTCDFTENSGSKKPYRVSNVVCSTEPKVPQ